MKPLATFAQEIEAKKRASEFAVYALTLMRAKGDLMAARALAEAADAPANVILTLRSAVAALSTNAASAQALSQYQVMVAGFIESLRDASVFDRLLPSMLRLPLRTRISAVTAAAVGAVTVEGSPKNVTKLSLNGLTLDPQKAAGLIVLNEELTKFPGVENFVGQELRSSIGTATDLQFLGSIAAGLSPISSSGNTAADVAADFSAMLEAVSIGASSKLAWIFDSVSARRLSVKVDSSGGRAFPEMGPTGGVICNIPALVSGGLPASSGGSYVLLVDAMAIAAESDVITLDASREAMLQLDTAPDDPPTAATSMTSLWQSNLVGLRAERRFGFQLIRSDGAALLSNVGYWNETTS